MVSLWFDLHDSLCRFLIVDDGEFYCLFAVFHHLIFDGLSGSVFKQDLFEILEGKSIAVDDSFLKVSALMFSVLAVVILAIALSDPNFKGFIGKVYNTIVEADYDTSSVLSSETNNSSENKTSSISSEHTSKNSKPEKIEENQLTFWV